jgi:hypothetical protein
VHRREIPDGDRQLVRMHVDSGLPRPRQIRRGSGMIGMAVSQKDCCRGHVGPNRDSLTRSMRRPSLAQPASINTHDGLERTKYTFVCVRPRGPRQYTSRAISHARTSAGASFALENIGGAQGTVSSRSFLSEIRQVVEVR